ncbi:MAG TPA: PEP/pyruvate-binding domain-containing protein [Devosia sp.]|uniref:PEP/pyruvate-binding domain-containing protein n=1 Tax=Devosia sp. TaxID=1871048 RepID=UPI002DDDB60A|nr:PEP/pyruvate-binding domain-containing protein [Devosia sp.]HEV2514154.1 PEP/pyruvate-binding domain-containing protein [Devosia sp.]
MNQFIHSMKVAAGPAVVGGKGATLMRLAGLGFDVPAFLVVEAAAFGSPESEAATATALLARLDEVGPGPYAVRSSAREEDGGAASHAGQFLSLLNVPAAEVPAAARNVFESGAAASVAEYRSSRRLGADGGAPAVVVQQMVNARCAGVLFTADPVSGRRDRIIVSAIAGLADRLVGGEEDGERYVLGKAGGVLERPEPGTLSEADLTALRALALGAEAAFGAPQDLEWAFAGSRLYLLQARPITTALRPGPIADPLPVVLDNSNIVESYPGLVSPLTFSFAQYAYARVYRAFMRLVGIDAATIGSQAALFDNLLSRVDGRVYYNLGNWYRALALLPGFSSNSANMELMMGVSEPLPADLVAAMAPPPQSRLARTFGLARVGWALGRESFGLSRTKRGFYARLQAALAEPASVLEQMPLTALAAEYRRIEADLLDRWDAPLVNDFLCMIMFGGSRKLMQAWAGEAGLAVHSDIMIGQGDIVSAEPAQRIRAMGKLLGGDPALVAELEAGEGGGLDRHPALQQAVSDYLERFADRCPEELKLESVTLDRDPSPLYRAIAAAAAAGEGHAVERVDPAAALKALFKGQPLRRAIAAQVLGIAKRRVRDRENLRFERTRIFGRGRRLFRAVGVQFHALGLLDTADDIFMLTVSEVLGAIEGFAVSHDLAALARLRRAEMAAAATRPDPPERLSLSGAVATVGSAIAPVAPRARDAARERSGVGCSAGVVRAVARVIGDPRTGSLRRGEILVARHTDPGWIALFTNAAAIVVERGSPLSHSAIVARELGIPCVVALKGAMEWIADGEMIEVDGATGQVRRVE